MLNVILTYRDGIEKAANIQSLRAYPPLLWKDEGNDKVPSYFVQTGDQLDGRYMEAHAEPILTPPETPSEPRSQ